MRDWKDLTGIYKRKAEFYQKEYRAYFRKCIYLEKTISKLKKQLKGK